MNEEVWVDVIDFEGLYKVSNLGRVKTLAKNILRANGSLMRATNEKVLRQIHQQTGYYNVSLYKERKQYVKSVHKIVYESFKGKTNLYIDHIKEGNKSDNRLVNLQAISQRENVIKSLVDCNKKTSSIYRGVTWNKYKGRWAAQITIGGKNNQLGAYESEIEASEAYQKALKNIK